VAHDQQSGPHVVRLRLSTPLVTVLPEVSVLVRLEGFGSWRADTLSGPALRQDFLQSNEEANVRVNGDIMCRPSQAQHMEPTLQTSVEEHGSRRRDAIGPLGSACQEIRLASERYAIGRIRSRRMISPLMRTDQMLTALEELNMLDVERVPESWLWQLGELVADLPFEYDPTLGQQPSPTAAIDLVFDIQEHLLELITGIEAEHEERLEAAS
jgi:hypothetical protein